MEPVLRNNPNHLVVHVSTNDVNSNKLLETIVKLVLDIAIWPKLTDCDVLISNILIRKDK